MCGTIGKLRALPGQQAAIGSILGNRAGEIPGLRFEYLFQSDADPQNLKLVVGFDSEDAYHANAQSQSQHDSYLAWRELLEADPEWNDGAIVQYRTTWALRGQGSEFPVPRTGSKLSTPKGFSSGLAEG